MCVCVRACVRACVRVMGASRHDQGQPCTKQPSDTHCREVYCTTESLEGTQSLCGATLFCVGCHVVSTSAAWSKMHFQSSTSCQICLPFKSKCHTGPATVQTCFGPHHQVLTWTASPAFMLGHALHKCAFATKATFLYTRKQTVVLQM